METAESLATPRKNVGVWKRTRVKKQDNNKKSVGQGNYIQISDDSGPGYEVRSEKTTMTG